MREKKSLKKLNLALHRCCGKIFCADCSENSTPLPSEQLYNPVRVCSDCFSRLHHHHQTNSCQCNARQHQGKTENENETPAANNGAETLQSSAMQTTCHRLKNLPTTKDTCCDNLLQATHQKVQPSVAAATANWEESPRRRAERGNVEGKSPPRSAGEWRCSLGHPIDRRRVSPPKFRGT